MALHFSPAEFAERLTRLQAAMQAKRLDAMFLFAQESMYWLTGYDTSGHSMFQGMYLGADGALALLTRSANQRQARLTSVIEDIRIWTDREGADPGGRTARYGGGLWWARKADRGRISRLRPHCPPRQNGRRRVRRLLRAGRCLRPRAPAASGQEPCGTGLSARGRAAGRRGMRGVAAQDRPGGFGRRRLRRDDEYDHARRRRPERQPLADGRRRGGTACPLPYRSPHGGAARSGAVRDRRRCEPISRAPRHLLVAAG